MINESSAKIFCKDAISKIENYDKAIADQTETWICHHRLGLTLDGEFAHSKDELKRLGMYLDRPYFELQFLPPSEHRRLHSTNRSDETRRKIAEAQKGKPSPMKGKTHSDETKRKMSEAKKGKPHSAEHVRKIAESNKGQTRSDETRQKISAAKKGKSRKPFSDETKRKMAEAKKGEKNPQYGKTKSDETKRKMSESHKARWARRKANA